MKSSAKHNTPVITKREADLPLWIDAQASGASPRSGGVLLELAWQLEGEEIEHMILKPPPGFRLSKRIKEITGLQSSTLARGRPPAEVAAALWASIRSRAGVVFVAHYARFERPFVLALLRAYPDQSDAEATLEATPWLCLHELGRRLLPDLPRASLRALAGYFGHHLPETRRSRPQLEATVTLSNALLKNLEAEDVYGLDAAMRWCEGSSRRRGRSTPPLDPLARLSLGSTPGIYRLLSRDRTPLYVGMARDLKRRVNQHFRGRKGREERHLELISQVFSVEVEACSSTLAAALRESAEIKAHQPIYNRSLLGEQALLFYASCDLKPLSDASEPSLLGSALGPFLKDDLVSIARSLLSWRRGHEGVAFWPFEPFSRDDRSGGKKTLHALLGDPDQSLRAQLRAAARISSAQRRTLDPFAEHALTIFSALERAQLRAELIERLSTIELCWFEPSKACLPLCEGIEGVSLRVRRGVLIEERALQKEADRPTTQSSNALPKLARRSTDRFAYDGGRIILNQLLRSSTDEQLWLRPPRGAWRSRASLEDQLERLRLSPEELSSTEGDELSI